MKTQISRDGFRADRRYSGVYQQQGRMITDRDWNELVDILKTRVDDALVDVIGTGSPKGRAVTLQMVGGTPRFLPGYVYAGGLAGFVEPQPDVTSFPVSLQRQKGFPSAPPPPPAGTAYNIYADVWERPVVSLEDEDLRDPAMHGADTCTRTQVLAQLKTCPVDVDPQSLPGAGDGRLTLRFPEAGGQTGSDPCDPLTQEVDPVGGDFLFRAEVHDVRWPNGAPIDLPERVVVKWSRENGAEQYALEDAPDWFSAGPWIYELYNVESEQHVGYHVPVLGSQSWEPKRGTLVTAFPEEAPEGTLIRRWDGYLVFVQDGGVWSLSSEEDETPDVTAPGATVTWETAHHGEITRQVARIALADLEILLEFFGIFIPGDYWSAPVRRAAYEAGKELLEEAFPSGVYHRYVPLATVQTNGQIVKPSNSQQRRLAFPRLTDLDAGDMAYSTTCGSGLFNNTHDTVKKALDRLCEIAALHVSYTKPADTSVFRGNNPLTVAQALDLLRDVQADDIGYVTTCGSGLFTNTHDTVKKALDRLCEIAAQHVSYTKPGDTSIFKGNNPLTVAQALNLLADVKADDIGYTTPKDSNVGNVNQALNVLFDRQAGAGNHFTVGQGGDFGSIPDAVNVLQNEPSVALALLPGIHEVEDLDLGSLNEGARFSLTGLGLASLVRVSGGISFRGQIAVNLENVAMRFEGGAFKIADCPEVTLKDSWFETALFFNSSMPVLEIDSDAIGSRVLIRGCLLDTQPANPDPHVGNVLQEFGDDIPDLFADGYSGFRTRVRNLAGGFFRLPLSERQAFAQRLRSRTPGTPSPLPPNEHSAYSAMATAIEATNFNPDDLVDAFDRLRLAIAINDPGTALVLQKGRSSVLLEGNDIRGRIGLYGAPGTGQIDTNTVWNRQKSGMYGLGTAGGDLQLRNNRVMGIRVAQEIVEWLQQFNPNNTPLSFPHPIQDLVLTDNRIEGVFNVFARRVQVSSTHFTSLNNVGWSVSDLGFYMGSHGENNLTGFTDMARTASNLGNLRLNITRLP